MAIEAYLLFNGNCREAVEFYANVFNTEKPIFMTYEEGHQNDLNSIPEEGVLPTKRAKHTLSKFRHEKSRYFLR